MKILKRTTMKGLVWHTTSLAVISVIFMLITLFFGIFRDEEMGLYPLVFLLIGSNAFLMRELALIAKEKESGK